MSSLALSAVLAAALLASGCGRDEAATTPSALDPDAASDEARYLAPPSVGDVRVGADGALGVSGQAPPSSQVALASPDGTVARAQADAKGAWMLKLGPASAPRLFALSATAAGRTLHAEGALLLAPGALSPAVTLRAGAASLPVSPLGGGLQVATVDYDPAGFLAVAGAARPRADVTLAIDGMAGAAGQADDAGRYALLAAGRRVPMGVHRLTVADGGARVSRDVELTMPASLTTPFAAERTASGWRVEWALTGGGVQTTLVLAP